MKLRIKNRAPSLSQTNHSDDVILQDLQEKVGLFFSFPTNKIMEHLVPFDRRYLFVVSVGTFIVQFEM